MPGGGAVAAGSRGTGACRVVSASSVGVIRACHCQAFHVAWHLATFIQSAVAVADRGSTAHSSVRGLVRARLPDGYGSG